MSGTESPAKLRIVTFNVLPQAYQLVSRWAQQGGHTIALVVTTPGPPTYRTPTYLEILALAPPEQEVLVTTRPRRVVAPLVAALQPDLIISFSFPYRLPDEILAVPRLGAVNLHPAALPAYRGPHPERAIYDGAPLLGATLHRTAAEFDTGAILSRRTAPLPADASPENIVATWGPLMMGALMEGLARAVAGDPGEPQDEAGASYAGAFTEAERLLSWELPMAVLQRRATALAIRGNFAQGEIDGQRRTVLRVDPLPAAATAAPGTVLDRTATGATVAVADGVVRATLAPLAE